MTQSESDYVAHVRHLVSVAPGVGLLADSITASPILYDSDRPGFGSATNGGGPADMLADLENTDPELAMVSLLLLLR